YATAEHHLNRAGTGDHEDRLGTRSLDRSRRLRDVAGTAQGRLYDRHDHDEDPGAEEVPQKDDGRPGLRLPASPTQRAGHRRHGPRFHRPRFQRLGRTPPRPPRPGTRPFPPGTRRDCAPAEAVMNLPLVWDNLVAYSMQIGLLVGLAAFVPAVLRLRLPASRLAYWHILLAACLLLPAVRPWKQAVLTLTAYVPTAITAPARPQPAPAPTVPLGEVALLLLGAGMLVRVAWLATGLWRLARLRRHSRPLRPVSSWSVEADIRVSDAISSPVTFGFLRPAVLLPANFPPRERGREFPRPRPHPRPRPFRFFAPGLPPARQFPRTRRARAGGHPL